MKIKSLERIPPNPGLLSQGAPVHTLPSFASNVLPTWLPHTNIGHLPRPKAASNTGRLGVSQRYECCPEGVFALGGTTKEFLGNSEET